MLPKYEGFDAGMRVLHESQNVWLVARCGSYCGCLIHPRALVLSLSVAARSLTDTVCHSVLDDTQRVAGQALSIASVLQ